MIAILANIRNEGGKWERTFCELFFNEKVNFLTLRIYYLINFKENNVSYFNRLSIVFLFYITCSLINYILLQWEKKLQKKW